MSDKTVPKAHPSAVSGDPMASELNPLNARPMVKRLRRKGEYTLVYVAAELATPLSETQRAIIDYMRSLPEGTIARTGEIITGTGLSRPAITFALAEFVYEKVAWPFPAPRYMMWDRRHGGPPVLTAKFLSKSGKHVEKALDADRERAQAEMVRFVRQQIRAGQLDRHSDVAKLYVHGTITEAELEPRYMYWLDVRGVWRSKIPLNNGKVFNRALGKRALDADRALAGAELRLVAFVKALVAVGQVDRDSPAAKLYLYRTDAEADPQILKAEFGTKSVKAPPCMRWLPGTFIRDDDPLRQRIKGRVLWSQIRLNDGTILEVHLGTDDEKVAATRMRPLVLEQMAKGKLDPGSKAARIYGADRRGQPSKWIGRDGPTPRAMWFFNLIDATLKSSGRSGRSSPTTGQIKKAIVKRWDELPPDLQELSVDTLRRRYSEVGQWLAKNSRRELVIQYRNAEVSRHARHRWCSFPSGTTITEPT